MDVRSAKGLRKAGVSRVLERTGDLEGSIREAALGFADRLQRA
jgi:hypothetical protein